MRSSKTHRLLASKDLPNHLQPLLNVSSPPTNIYFHNVLALFNDMGNDKNTSTAQTYLWLHITRGMTGDKARQR